MKRILLFACFILMISQLSAQSKGISITGGIGSYELTDLKTYQIELIDRLPVAVRQFESFPVYTSFRIHLFKTLESGISYGLSYAFSCTGSHANYTDFSGYLNLNQTISAYQLGFSGTYPFLDFYVSSEKHLDFSVYGDIRLAYVRDNVNAAISAGYYFENNSLNLTAMTPISEFGLQSMFHLSKISLGVEAGYLVDMGAKMKVGEQSILNPSISLQPTDQLKSNISGIRLGLKLIIWMTSIE